MYFIKPQGRSYLETDRIKEEKNAAVIVYSFFFFLFFKYLQYSFYQLASLNAFLFFISSSFSARYLSSVFEKKENAYNKG